MAAVNLPDVLEMIPVDVISASCWHVGFLTSDFRALSLACPRLRSICIDITYTAFHDIASGLAQPPADRLSRLAHVQHMPQLDVLTLTNWSGEAALLSTLQDYKAATNGGVVVLGLHGGQLSPAGVSAIHLAFPHLSSLHLGGGRDSPVEAFRHQGVCVLLDAPLFFEELCSCPLVNLVMRPGAIAWSNSLPSVAGLKRLQHLEMQLTGGVEPAHLAALTTLTRLTVCQLSSNTENPRLSLVDAAPLLSSSLRLCKLSLSVVQCASHGDQQRATHVAAVLLQLGSLTGLLKLELGRGLSVDDAVFGALCRLTRLTELCVGRMRRTTTTSGHLPLLRTLRLYWATPVCMLATLQPLLPLPSLQVLITTERAGQLPAFWLDVVHLQSLHHAAAAQTALRAVASHMAAAPQLRLPDAILVTGVPASGSPPSTQLTLQQVASSLEPLHGRFSGLFLDGMHLKPRGWQAMLDLLPGTDRLFLQRCTFTAGAELAALVSGCKLLTSLHVKNCPDLPDEAWKALAIACAHPLQLRVQPLLAPQMVAECRSMQQRHHGRQTITWVLQ